MIEGRVVGSGGEPVAAGVQAVVREDSGPEGPRPFGPGGYADAGGRFRMLVAGEGPAALSVTAIISARLLLLISASFSISSASRSIDHPSSACLPTSRRISSFVVSATFLTSSANSSRIV